MSGAQKYFSNCQKNPAFKALFSGTTDDLITDLMHNFLKHEIHAVKKNHTSILYKEERDEAIRCLKNAISQLKTDSYVIACIIEGERIIKEVTGETMQFSTHNRKEVFKYKNHGTV